MNSFLLLIIAVPIAEIFILIKIGTKIGAINTILLIFLTAFTGVYFAKQQGLSTLRSGLMNAYQNKVPIYEVVSGASIALAAVLLIFPGFLTDTLGFILLIPLTRSLIINQFVKMKKEKQNNDNEIIEAEVIEKEDKKDEL
ncbi:MAG: FxsA family protein [Pseudomonadota bacterium]|nr:FxsA family protein [Pseudomonadota bacterium]|tara:strand:- start:92 stop:514 length:423 start_codon:yes stop_codon:yes gene_type:complete